MHKLKSTLLSRDNYRLAFLFVTLIYSIGLLAFTSTVLNFLLLVWGAVLFLYDLFTRRIMFQSRRSYLLIAFMLLYVVTLTLNYQMGLFENLKVFGVTGLQLFLLLPYDKEAGHDQLIRHIRRFNQLIVVFTFVFSLLAILMYIFWINGTVGEVEFGSKNGLLFGLYSGPNTGAPLAAISLLVTLIDAHISQRFPPKWMIANIAVQLSFIYLTNSRATLYSLLAVLALYSLVYLHGIKRKAIGLAGTVLTFALKDVIKDIFYWIQSGIQWLVYWVTGLFSSSSATDTDTTPPVITPPDKVITMGFLNGRAELWQCGAKIIRDYPLFGVGSRNIPEVALQYASLDKLPGIYGGGMHNILVQLMVSNGILGFLTLFAFAVICIVEVVRFFRYSRLSGENSRLVFLGFSLLLMLLINNMAEANILFAASFMATIFWSYLGFILCLCDKQKQERQQ